MKIMPPRASVVFNGHSIVIINPPSAEIARAYSGESAMTATLDWVLAGMIETNPLGRARSLETVIESFMQMGITRSDAEAMAAAAAASRRGVLADTQETAQQIPVDKRSEALEGARKLAFAINRGRLTIDDLRKRDDESLRDAYDVRYPAAIRDAKLANVHFLERFPVVTAFYGYSRGSVTPTETPRLNWYRDHGRLRLYGNKIETEALLFSLDPVAIVDWATRGGFSIEPVSDARSARLAILHHATFPMHDNDAEIPTLGSRLLELIHSYAHRVMRAISSICGIERDSLVEYLVPEHLSFAIYANNRGDFILGGLQALFENDLDRALSAIVDGERRCALDPGCRESGSACMACLYVGEPSCRLHNRWLTRDVLFARGLGYLST